MGRLGQGLAVPGFYLRDTRGREVKTEAPAMGRVTQDHRAHRQALLAHPWMMYSLCLLLGLPAWPGPPWAQGAVPP